MQLQSGGGPGSGRTLCACGAMLNFSYFDSARTRLTHVAVEVVLLADCTYVQVGTTLILPIGKITYGSCVFYMIELVDIPHDSTNPCSLMVKIRAFGYVSAPDLAVMPHHRSLVSFPCYLDYFLCVARQHSPVGRFMADGPLDFVAVESRPTFMYTSPLIMRSDTMPCILDLRRPLQ